ncbi:MAG TPA: TerC/Alx family metal homeostasis membrane protein [Saprospiraceae bacterium]|nr:TerC/Alx family metal homeostasis membrane protein [Saprospiraceae bacterium]
MVWTVFIIFILLLLFVDLYVLNKSGEVINNKKAAKQTAFWVAIAMAFSVVVYYLYQNGLINNPNNLKPSNAMAKYITGYLIELSLSVDNLFVIAMIFKAYKIPPQNQHRALFWGIIGAILFRGIVIYLGVFLIQKISWMTYIFGAFLIFTAFKMIMTDPDDEEAAEEKSKKTLSRFLPISANLDGEKFWTIENGKRIATPLFGALLLIEFSDIVFALDSIPAIIAITTDTFLVFSSNIFAILGLRSMYFFLANMLRKFEYLEYSVAAILVFVGLKLMAAHHVVIPEWFSLAFIFLSLLVGVIVSIRKMKKEEAK